MKRFLKNVHATPTDKKDGEDRGVAVVTRRRLRPITLTAVPVLAEPTDTQRKAADTVNEGKARESTTEEGLAPRNADSRGGKSIRLCGRCGVNPARPRSRFINGRRYDTIKMCSKCDAIRKRNQKSSRSRHCNHSVNSWSNQKYRTNVALRAAVKRGRIVKPASCELCKTKLPPRKLHGHHEDYSDVLTVMWLCQKCHMERHRKYK